MIVEYIGIPGCGKTYQANICKKALKAKGTSFIDLSRWKGMPLWLKIFYKATDNTFIFIPKYKKLRESFQQLCKDSYGKEPRFLPFSIDYCIDRIISSVFLQDVFGGGKRVSINDEGLLQWVVFLNVQYGIEIKDIMSLIKPLNVHVKTTFIDTQVTTAFANIRKRNRHICPMDELDDVVLQEYLEIFHSVCVLVVSLLSNDIETNMDGLKNV